MAPLYILCLNPTKALRMAYIINSMKETVTEIQAVLLVQCLS